MVLARRPAGARQGRTYHAQGRYRISGAGTLAPKIQGRDLPSTRVPTASRRIGAARSGGEVYRQAQILVGATRQPHEAVGREDRPFELGRITRSASGTDELDELGDLVERDL